MYRREYRPRGFERFVAEKEPHSFGADSRSRPHFDLRTAPGGRGANECDVCLWGIEKARQRSDERCRLIVVREFHHVKLLRPRFRAHGENTLVSLTPVC